MLSFASASEALHSLFQSMDQNEDGKIDHGEFTGNMTKYVFNRIDSNDDSIISRSEWDYIQNVKDKELHNDLYKGIDINSNRIIRYNELSGYAEKHSNLNQSFLSLDKKRDGVLMPDENPDRSSFKMVTIRL